MSLKTIKLTVKSDRKKKTKNKKQLPNSVNSMSIFTFREIMQKDEWDLMGKTLNLIYARYASSHFVHICT